MRYCVFSALFLASSLSGVSFGQQSNVSATTSVDINGNRVADGPLISRTKSANGSVITETRQSINGQSVPTERVEERVLRDDASGKVVERIIRDYDPEGNPMPAVKETIEEQKHADGSSSTQSTTSRGDVNGNMQVIERTTTESHTSGSSETSQTVVERPTADGLRTVEKREEVTAKQPGGYQSETTIYRADGNGGFQTAVRETTQHTEQGSEASDSSAEYDMGPTGQLQLHSQTVTKTVTRPDGSKDAVVDIYGRAVPGTVDANDSALKLYEQQTIETAPGPNNTVVQTLSVRRPTVSDPGILGPSRQLSQTVCQGDCKPQKTGQ